MNSEHQAVRGSCDALEPPGTLSDTEAAEVAHIADRVRHAADLAFIAAHGEEPERALRYLLDSCAEHVARLRELAARLSPLLAALLILAA